jgi:hypothetical protein
MRLVRLALVLAISLPLLPAVAGARVDPGVEEWVFTGDIPPFTFPSKALLGRGGRGITAAFGEHPENLVAAANYRDTARGMFVEVTVQRVARTDFVDHLIEARVRSQENARVVPGGSMVIAFDQPLYFYCGGDGCNRRVYRWRSGPQIVVDINADGVASDGADIPCPEPTELLQAYLQRYPSSLTFQPDSDERAAQFRRDQLALRLSAAQHWLTQTATAAEDDQIPLLHEVGRHLTKFAQIRAAAFGTPSLLAEAQRIHDALQLPVTTQQRKLHEILSEYQGWWAQHQNDPVRLPPVATPTAAAPAGTPTP